MAKIRNEELDALTGEVLPDRTVLGTAPAAGHGANSLGLNLCNNVNQSQTQNGNIIAIAINLPQCGLSNKGSAGLI